MATVFLCSVYSRMACVKGIFRIISKISSFLNWCVLLHARYFMACKLSHRCSHSVNVLHAPVYFRNSPQLLCLINLLFVTTVQFLRYMCMQFFLSLLSWTLRLLPHPFCAKKAACPLGTCVTVSLEPCWIIEFAYFNSHEHFLGSLEWWCVCVLLYPSNNTLDVLTNLPGVMISFSFYVALIVDVVPHLSICLLS